MLLLSYSAITALLVAGVASTDYFPDCIHGPLNSTGVCNMSLNKTARAQALVALLTTSEKISNMVNRASGVSRLGLPAYNWWNEALHGYATSQGSNFAKSGNFSSATSFPQPIVMGAAFDDRMIVDVATVVSTEARAFSNANWAGLEYWTPNINPYRDPRWGRGQETPGEDPYHLQQYVSHLLEGLQQDGKSSYRKIGATCKHFAGYDFEGVGSGVDSRMGFNAIISQQDLVEFYLPPFRTCAKDSSVASIMCSYNSINGVPSCANEYLLQTILREHWDWEDDDQYIVSDCDAVSTVYSPQGYAATPQAGAADSLKAGTDLDCGTWYSEYLATALNQSLIAESDIDRALTRLYASLVSWGYFDNPAIQPYRQLSWSDVNTPSAQELAYTAAVSGAVLLKNDGTLPLSVGSKSVALIGPWANATTQMQGNYAGVAYYLHSPLYAAQQLDWNVNYVMGTSISASNTTGFPAAMAAAQAADIVIYIGGIDNSIEAEASDRTTIVWPGNQLDLISELGSLGKPLIVVQMGGGQIDDSALLANKSVNAILWGGYPGQDGGPALMDIIAGNQAPAGRLPITQYPAHYVTDIVMTDMALRPNGTTPGRTYKWYSTPVLEFGFGLHYTNFSLGWVPGSNNQETFNIQQLIGSTTDWDHVELQSFKTFELEVSNVGTVTSDYVALLFLTSNAGPAPYPIKSLVSYDRIHSLRHGTTSTTTLPVTLGSLARVDEDGNTTLYPGDYSVIVDVPGSLTWNFTLTGRAAVLEQFPKNS